jgi:hypothetical protein
MLFAVALPATDPDPFSSELNAVVAEAIAAPDELPTNAPSPTIAPDIKAVVADELPVREADPIKDAEENADPLALPAITPPVVDTFRKSVNSIFSYYLDYHLAIHQIRGVH